MTRPALRIRFHQVPIKRKVWITDLDALNYIVDVGNAACTTPDKFHIEMLAQAIRDAEGDYEKT